MPTCGRIPPSPPPYQEPIVSFPPISWLKGNQLAHDEARDRPEEFTQLLVLVDESLDPRPELVQLVISTRLVKFDLQTHMRHGSPERDRRNERTRASKSLIY